MESQEKDRQKEHYQSKQQKEVVQRQITTAVDCQSSGVHYEEGHKLSLKEQNEDENTNDSSCHPLQQNQELCVSPSSTDIRTSAPRATLALKKDSTNIERTKKSIVINSQSRTNTEEITTSRDLNLLPTSEQGVLNTTCYRQDNEEIRLPPQLYEQKFKNDEQADLDASLLGSEQADKKQQSKRGSDETAKISMMMTPTLLLSSKAKKRKPFYRHDELLESSDEAPDVEHIVPGINLGRRGDPRMHKAVSVRLANPSMSLLDALLEGGFQFPRHELAASSGKSDRDILDEDGVQLCQRKNQLSRRLRMIRKKREGCSKHDLSLLGTTNRNPVLQQEFNPDRLVKPLAAVSKIKQQEQLYTSTQEQVQHEQQQQQEQRALEYKQPLQNYAGWLPPGVFPSFTTSTDSTRSRTVDEFTCSSSYPPQYRHSENTVRNNNTSTTTRSLVDLLKENQAQMNTEAMILDLIRGKHDARWNNTNALSRVLGSSIGQSVYPPSPTTNPFLEPISQQHYHPTHTTPNMSSSTLESSYQRPGMLQHPLHQLGQESTGTTTRANIIASHPPPAPPPNEQEKYLSNLVAMLASNNHDQNYTFSVPRTLRNQPTFATNEIMNMNATTTNDTIPPHPAPTLHHTFVQQSLIDDNKNANMYRLASQLSSFPELLQGAALGSHHDSIHTTSIIGQLAFEQKLTLAVQIYKSVRKGLIIECLKNAGFAQGDVIDNNELFLMLFERKLNESTQDRPASSGEEERATSEQEKVLGVKEDDHG